uniref:Putative secreted protein n=1 Tax=Anopheles darlingi TaxID=43151 RepID=A0A2M4D3X8_ANODA
MQQLLLLLVVLMMVRTDLLCCPTVRSSDIVVDNVMLHYVHLLGREQYDVTDAPDRIGCCRCSGCDIIFASSSRMHQHQLGAGGWCCNGVATSHRTVPF